MDLPKPRDDPVTSTTLASSAAAICNWDDDEDAAVMDLLLALVKAAGAVVKADAVAENRLKDTKMEDNFMVVGVSNEGCDNSWRDVEVFSMK